MSQHLGGGGGGGIKGLYQKKVFLTHVESEQLFSVFCAGNFGMILLRILGAFKCMLNL